MERNYGAPEPTGAARPESCSLPGERSSHPACALADDRTPEPPHASVAGWYDVAQASGDMDRITAPDWLIIIEANSVCKPCLHSDLGRRGKTPY